MGSVGEEIAMDCKKMGAADYLLKDRLASLGPVAFHSLDQNILRSEWLYAEEPLWESNGRSAALVQASPLPIIALNLDGRFQAWNPASITLCGRSDGEILVIQDFHGNSQ